MGLPLESFLSVGSFKFERSAVWWWKIGDVGDDTFGLSDVLRGEEDRSFEPSCFFDDTKICRRSEDYYNMSGLVTANFYDNDGIDQRSIIRY